MVQLKGKIYQRLAEEQVVIPHLERALMADEWPESYNIPVEMYPHRPPPPGEVGWFYPSTHCLMEDRQLYYEMHPVHRYNLPKKTFPMSATWSLTMGTAAHSIVQTQLTMAGKIVDPKRDIEVRFRNEQRRCRGRLDWIQTMASGRKIPVEMKTQNSRAFGFQKEIADSWECQLQTTMDGLGYDEGVVFLMEMGYPWGMREFRVYRDEALLKAIYAKWERVLEAVYANEPPGHCCEKGSKEMDNCRAKDVCWLASAQVRGESDVQASPVPGQAHPQD
jgi:hypothetical protein